MADSEKSKYAFLLRFSEHLLSSLLLMLSFTATVLLTKPSFSAYAFSASFVLAIISTYFSWKAHERYYNRFLKDSGELDIKERKLLDYIHKQFLFTVLSIIVLLLSILFLHY